MEPLALSSVGRFEVSFTLHLRAPDPSLRARSATPILPEVDGGARCGSWIAFDLRSERRPSPGEDETVRLEPPPAVRPEDGPALRRCTPLALRCLPKAFRSDPQDREDLTEDAPHHLMAFLDVEDFDAVVAIVGYYVLGYGANFPFRDGDPGRKTLLALVDALPSASRLKDF